LPFSVIVQVTTSAAVLAPREMLNALAAENCRFWALSCRGIAIGSVKHGIWRAMRQHIKKPCGDSSGASRYVWNMLTEQQKDTRADAARKGRR
jgi:hypothetical protein